MEIILGSFIHGDKDGWLYQECPGCTVNVHMLEQDNQKYTLGKPCTIRPRGFVNERRAYSIC